MNFIKITFTLIILTFSAGAFCQHDEMPQMRTPWTAGVDRALPLNEYPRPTMVREDWFNLNGPWQYAITHRTDHVPARWEGEILVPFPVESYLSGVQKKVNDQQALWYKRIFEVQGAGEDERVILHFGAVDYEARVFMNGQQVHTHTGGYTGFSVDITPFLTGNKEELIVRVLDPTTKGEQPRGKQVENPGGIYYTSNTGIWQTVWYEVVPSTYMKSYKIVTDITTSEVFVYPEIYNRFSRDEVSVAVSLEGNVVAEGVFDATGDIALTLPAAQLWSPDSPTLYDLAIRIVRDGKVIDQVEGYLGMRSMTLGKDARGDLRILLNGEPLFQYGPLDQGYWPDGIYTAPTEEALVSDIQRMKDMGFNMVRKHVKVEPERWYYHCDRLGLIVWQDMPSGFGEIVPVKDHDRSTEGDWLDKHYEDVTRSFASEQSFRNQLKAMIDQFYNHPSIGVWVPFNESWGQFKTNEILHWTKTLDSTRLVDGPSGWIDRGGGDIRDYHLYGDRLGKDLPLEEKRAVVIGEFGGLGFPVEGHLYAKDAWSYQGYKNRRQLEKAYQGLLDRVLELKKAGYSAAVYTQLTDVETEINGLITYDRQVIKIPSKRLYKLHQALYAPLE